MLAKTIFAATFLALAQFAVATPPGCLLGAVNEYDDPSDIKSVCKEKGLSSKVATFCGDNTEAALEALADICNDQGVKICMYHPFRNVIEEELVNQEFFKKPCTLKEMC